MDRCRGAFLVLLLAGCAARTPFDGSQSDGVVRGTVIDEAGEPFVGAKVRIDTTITVTDEQGRFSVPAPAIYDAAIVVHGNGFLGVAHAEGDVYAYQGMSRRDPIFKTSGLYAPSSSPRRANIAMTFPQTPSGSVRSAVIRAFKGDSRYVSYRTKYDAHLDTLDAVRWVGSETIGLEFYAFQYETDPATDAAGRYLAFDKLERSLSPGDQVDWRVDWKPMPYREATIRGTVRLPDGYEIWSTNLQVQPPSTLLNSWFLGTLHRGPEVSFAVPDLPGATYSLTVRAGNGVLTTERTVDHLTPSSPAAPLEPEAAPRAVSPAEFATGVGIDTEFTWENSAHGVSFVRVIASGSADLVSYMLFTNGTSMRIPDVSDMGIVFPREAEYQWAVSVVTSDSVDQLAPHGIDNTDFRERDHTSTGARLMTTR